MVIPSTEIYLCNGIVDFLTNEIKGIKVFGPTKAQAKIEGSKHFSKTLMTELDIPTAKFKFFIIKEEAISYIKRFYMYLQSTSMVIKYSGLASGKGVYLPKDHDEAVKCIDELYEKNKENWEGVIIETMLKGSEVSVIAFCDGEKAYLMPQAQDYKRIYDDDLGPNTGGMGAICPVHILNKKEISEVNEHMNKIVKHLNYKGVLYAGIMKTDEHFYFLEFNCRFGDPEAQVILNLLDTDLLYIIETCINGSHYDGFERESVREGVREGVREMHIKWKKQSAATVILSHIDYPYSKLNYPVEITEKPLDHTVKTYESNVIINYDKKYTTGGRVLSMVSVTDSLQQSLENIYNNLHKITYEGVYYRRDIGTNNIGYKRTDTEKRGFGKDNVWKRKDVSIGVLASGNATSIEGLFDDKYTSECIKVFITDNTSHHLIKKANDKNIPYIHLGNSYWTEQSKKTYYERVVDMLRYFNVDMVILSGYMRIVPDILFKEFYTINIHPSLLPKHEGLKGDTIHNLTIKNKEIFIGCTLHEVTDKVDGGRILLQRQGILDTRHINYDNVDGRGDPNILNKYVSVVKKQVQSLEKRCIYDFINNYQTGKKTYDIDIEESNIFVDNLKKNGVIKNEFCALYEHNGFRLGASADGCGTKLDMANKYGFLDQIGIDLVAMNVNDLLAGGCKPLFFMDYIAIDKMDKGKCNEIVEGIIKGCEMCGCTLIGGETAEMKGIYLKNKMDLAGFAVGEKIYDFPRKNLMHEKCYLYGLKSSGIHSNGYTLVKKLWEQCSSDKPSIEELLTPTHIYSELIQLFQLYNDSILGVAHITGGGFEDNIMRILPEHLSFSLNEWVFPDIFKWIQRESKLTRDEMLGVFNCGYGIVLVTRDLIDLAEYGIPCDLIGHLQTL